MASAALGHVAYTTSESSLNQRSSLMLSNLDVLFPILSLLCHWQSLRYKGTLLCNNFFLDQIKYDVISYHTFAQCHFDNISINFTWADASLAEFFYGLKRVNLHVSDHGMIEAPLSRLQQYLSILTTVSNHLFSLCS